MTDWPEVPNIAEALAPHIGGLPDAGRPALLAGLERAAAGRYRGWADALPEHSAVLGACAAREEEIADLAIRHFPVSPEVGTAVEAALPGALEKYDELFRPFSTREQLFLQSEAELQGAAAWAAMAGAVEDEALRQVLARCRALEEESSAAVKQLLPLLA